MSERIIFKKNNLRYSQDFQRHIGIPENIKFTVLPINKKEGFTLQAFGYGIINKGKGSYGNGQLFVYYPIDELRKHSIREQPEQQEYKEYEFCKFMDCGLFQNGTCHANKHEHLEISCPFNKKQFKKYLELSDYKIIKQGDK